MPSHTSPPRDQEAHPTDAPRPAMLSPLRAWLGLFLFLLALYGSYSIWRVYQAMADAPSPSESRPTRSPAVPAHPPRPLGDFRFLERSGRKVQLSELKGKVWIASFFFADCPGFCLQMNHQVAALAKEFAGYDLSLVSITVDPKDDTPQRLREYADHQGFNDQRWIFLAGDMADVEQLGQDVFKVTVQGQEHSDRLILVGPDGRVLGRYSALDPSHILSLKRKLKQLLPAPSKET